MQFDNLIAELELDIDRLEKDNASLEYVAEQWEQAYHLCFTIREGIEAECDEAKRGNALLQVENHSLRSERDEFRDISDEFVGYYHEAVKRRDEMQANYYKAVAKANEENETVAVWVAESGRWESNYYTAKRQRDEMEGKFHVVSRERDNAEREQAKSDIAFERIKKERDELQDDSESWWRIYTGLAAKLDETETEREKLRAERDGFRKVADEFVAKYHAAEASEADTLRILEKVGKELGEAKRGNALLQVENHGLRSKRDEYKEDYDSLAVAFDKTALALDEMGEERDTYKVYVDFYEETKARMKEVFDD